MGKSSRFLPPYVKLFKRHYTSSKPGDLVLDPFSGTFTTGFVAKELGRRFVGIEIEEEYVKIGLRRMNLATHFKGELLVKPLKSYESGYSEKETAPMLLDS
jgi:site-specific DNA-methyltransferase (adenine-specific)